MLAVICSALRRRVPVVLLALSGLFGAAEQAGALTPVPAGSRVLTDSCSINYEVTETSASLILDLPGPMDAAAGGAVHTASGIQQMTPITVAALEQCGLSDINSLVVQGPSVSVAEDERFLLEFRAVFPDGKEYLVHASLGPQTYSPSGATFFHFGLRTNTPPAIDDANFEFRVGEEAAIWTAGRDPDMGTVLTYTWRQTDTTGVSVPISDANQSMIIFEAPALPEGMNEITLEFTVTVSDGLASAEAVVSVRVRSENVAPVVVAAADREVEQGQIVEISGTASDANGDTLTAEWTSDIDLQRVPSLGPYRPSFVMPTLNPGDADLVITFTLTVSDSYVTSSDTMRITVKAPFVPGNDAPVARIVGPSSAREDALVVLDGDWSTDPDLNGLTYRWEQFAGVSVIGRTTAIDQPTLEFVAPKVPQDAAFVLLSFRLTVSDGTLSHSTMHDVVVSRWGLISRQTAAIVSRAVTARLGALVDGQTDLGGVLGGSGGANVAISSKGGIVDLATAPDAPFWFRLSANWSTLAGAKSDYALGSAGMHVKFGDRLALGVMAQADRSRSVDGVALSKGTGWLVGPYVVARMPSQPVIVQGRLLYGQTSNRLAPLGTFEDRFDGTRLLAQLGVAGEIAQGEVTWRPDLQASYAREDLEGYVDGIGNVIPGQRQAMAQVSAGLEVGFPVEVRSGAMRATVGMSNIWAESSTGASALDGYRGKVSMGVRRDFASGAGLSVSGSYDGLGGVDLERYGLDIVFEHRF